MANKVLAINATSSLLKKRAFLASCLPVSLVCRSKVNIKHPRPVHKERRVLDAVTQPVYLNYPRDSLRLCSILESSNNAAKMKQSVDQRKRYEAFLEHEVKKILESSRMIIAFQPEALDARKRTQICNKLLAAGFSAIFYPVDVLRKAVSSSKWQNMATVLQSQTVLVVSPHVRMPELLNVTKKMPELVLLGGFVDDTLLTREGVTRYSRLPSIHELHSELVGLLSLPAAKSRSLMLVAQQGLVRSLEWLCKRSDV